MTRRSSARRSLRLESLDESRLVDLVAALLHPAAEWVELARRDHRGAPMAGISSAAKR